MLPLHIYSKVGNWKVSLNIELGVPGILTILIIVCTIFKALDILVIYCFLYFGGACIGTYIVYVKKAIKKTRMFTDKMPQ